MIDTLMEVSDDGKGSFVDCLRDLGLDADFLRDYPISLLVDWGWLRPQFRIVFPRKLFDAPAQQTPTWPPEYPQAKNLFEQVWLKEWRFDAEDEPMWFVHPVFRPGNEAHTLFAQNCAAAGLADRPPSFKCDDGSSMSPYVDYFYPWQAYALIDVIKAADVFSQSKRLLNTPDVQKRALSLLSLAQTPLWKPEKTLDSARQWAAWAEPLTWLSHFSSLRGNIEWHRAKRADQTESEWHSEQSQLIQCGAVRLANFLEISAPQLEQAIKDQLLVLAQNWEYANAQNCPWIRPAWGAMQTDLCLAVEWLCILTNNNFEDYCEKWAQTSQQNEGWAELHSVLPFEFYTDQQYFLRIAPYYLKGYDARLAKKFRLVSPSLALVIKNISRKNRHFNSFLSSFRKLHEQLNSKPTYPGGIDFTNRSPLDYYLLLAIRAETCFKDELHRRDKLGNNDGLESYLRQLSVEVNLDSKAKGRFESHVNSVRNLRKMPSDFIESISGVAPQSGCSTAPIAQAMLCCLAARNYFAHHDYHDEKLLRSESSQFLLGGILVAVLTLLNDK